LLKQFAIQEESPNTLKRELQKENDISLVGSNLNDVLSKEAVNKSVQEDTKVPYPGKPCFLPPSSSLPLLLPSSLSAQMISETTLFILAFTLGFIERFFFPLNIIMPKTKGFVLLDTCRELSTSNASSRRPSSIVNYIMMMNHDPKKRHVS
jgi:hypothetical protein